MLVKLRIKLVVKKRIYRASTPQIILAKWTRNTLITWSHLKMASDSLIEVCVLLAVWTFPRVRKYRSEQVDKDTLGAKTISSLNNGHNCLELSFFDSQMSGSQIDVGGFFNVLGQNNSRSKEDIWEKMWQQIVWLWTTMPRHILKKSIHIDLWSWYLWIEETQPQAVLTVIERGDRFGAKWSHHGIPYLKISC